MNTSLMVCCPRCSVSSQLFSFDELREHVAKEHLEMPSLFNCPHCQAGFISPQQALHHIRTTCSIQKQYLTMGFMKNLLSMDSSFFKELFVIESEAIRNLLSVGSVPVSPSSPLVEDREKEGSQEKPPAESDERNSPELPPRKLKIEPCDSSTISTITLSTSQPPKDCPVSSRRSRKRARRSETAPVETKRQKTDDQPMEKKSLLSSANRDAERLKDWETIQKDKDIIERGCKGTVKWYSVRDRYGFISRSDGQGDVFVHQMAIAKSTVENPLLRSLAADQEVEFDVLRGKNGLEAGNVTGPNKEVAKCSTYRRAPRSRNRRGNMTYVFTSI